MAPFTYTQLKSECSYEEIQELERNGLAVEIVDDCPPANIYVDRV